MQKYTFIAIFFLLLTTACDKAPEFSEIPALTFLSNSRDSIIQSDLPLDSLFVAFSFTDGDGDIGLGPQDTFNIFIRDQRTGFLENKFRIPEIPVQGTANGIEGEVEVLIFTTCCLFDNGIPPCSNVPTKPLDTLVYEIFIEDRAGNKSNVIETAPIILKCQ